MAPPKFGFKFVSLGTILFKKIPNWQMLYKIGGYFWIVIFFKNSKKELVEAYNSHDYMPMNFESVEAKTQKLWPKN